MKADPNTDLLILGGGTAGLVAASLAAGFGASVTLVERDRTGGDCLWTGCVPSKGLLEAAATAHAMRTADSVGIAPAEPSIDLGRILTRVREVQAEIEPQDSPEYLRSLGVEVLHDDATFAGPRSVRLAHAGRTLHAARVLIATGSEPVIPPVDGLREAEPLTTDSVWDLAELPPRLVILGGGAIGCELGQAFARLGSAVTLVEMAPHLLPVEDPAAGALIEHRLCAEGVDVRTGAQATRVEMQGELCQVTVSNGDGTTTLAAERLLVAAGRRSRTADLNLAAAGVRTNGAGDILTSRHLETSAAGVYAAGDVNGHLPFTHAAAYQASIATFNALLMARRAVSYRSVPWVTFTEPEIARVGVTEAQARELWGDDVTTSWSDYAHVDRALTAARGEGFAKLVGDRRGRLVGATVAAPAAGEVIAEFAAIIARGGRMGDVYRTVHPYPTYALGAATAGAAHLQKRWLTDRTRTLLRPVLAATRLRARMSR